MNQVEAYTTTVVFRKSLMEKPGEELKNVARGTDPLQVLCALHYPFSTKNWCFLLKTASFMSCRA